MPKITQAVILSAGLGTRLRPLTDNIPKVMVPLGPARLASESVTGRKPLLEWHIEQFKKSGVKEFFINLFYLPEVVRNYFGDGSRWGVKITYVLEEPEIRGTAGGVKNFDNFLDEAFFVLYGDMFSLVDYQKMADAFFQKTDAIGLAVIGRNDHPWDSDLVEVAADLQFLKIHRKPHQELPKEWRTLDAVYIFKKKILSFIPPVGTYYEIDHQLLPDVLAKGEKFYGYETSDYLKDIGTPERYKAVEEYLISLRK